MRQSWQCFFKSASREISGFYGRGRSLRRSCRSLMFLIGVILGTQVPAWSKADVLVVRSIDESVLFFQDPSDSNFVLIRLCLTNPSGAAPTKREECLVSSGHPETRIEKEKLRTYLNSTMIRQRDGFTFLRPGLPENSQQVNSKVARFTEFTKKFGEGALKPDEKEDFDYYRKVQAMQKETDEIIEQDVSRFSIVTKKWWRKKEVRVFKVVLPTDPGVGRILNAFYDYTKHMLNFVKIPKGTFFFGAIEPREKPSYFSSKDDAESLKGPVEYTIGQEFEMQTTPFTRGAMVSVLSGIKATKYWDSFLGSLNYIGNDYKPRCADEYDPSCFDFPALDFSGRLTLPAVLGFISTLNAQDPYFDYRLPTEQEWEWAALGGNLGKPAWYGDVTPQNNLSFSQRPGGSKEYYQRWIDIYSVFEKPVNPYGLYDMTGNVLQWVTDRSLGPVLDPAIMHSWGENGAKYLSLRGSSSRDHYSAPEDFNVTSPKLRKIPSYKWQEAAVSPLGLRLVRYPKP